MSTFYTIETFGDASPAFRALLLCFFSFLISTGDWTGESRSWTSRGLFLIWGEAGNMGDESWPNPCRLFKWRQESIANLLGSGRTDVEVASSSDEWSRCLAGPWVSINVTVPCTLRSVLTLISTGLLGEVDVGTDFLVWSVLSPLSPLSSSASSTLIGGLGDGLLPKNVFAFISAIYAWTWSGTCCKRCLMVNYESSWLDLQ